MNKSLKPKAELKESITKQQKVSFLLSGAMGNNGARPLFISVISATLKNKDTKEISDLSPTLIDSTFEKRKAILRLLQ